MSDAGKLQRGALWYSKRNVDGKLPDGVANDPNKMKDVNFYLESIKPKEEPKPKEVIKETKSKVNK